MTTTTATKGRYKQLKFDIHQGHFERPFLHLPEDNPQQIERERVLDWYNLVEELFRKERKRVGEISLEEFANVQETFEKHRSGFELSKQQPNSRLQFNLREIAQTPGANRILSLDNIFALLDTLPPGSWVEFNANGQTSITDEEFEKIIRHCTIKGLQPTLHAGAKPGLVRPTLSFLSERGLQNNVILKVYARVEKYNPQDLRAILQEATKAGIDPQNIRVGLEHLSSLLYSGLTNPGERGEDAMEVLGVLDDILGILTEFGVTRLSGPETRGIADNPKYTYAMMRALLKLLQGKDFRLTSFEAHCHNDNYTADENTLAIIQAIHDHNVEFGTQIEAVADTTLGLGERNGICNSEVAARFVPSESLEEMRVSLEKMLGLNDLEISESERLRAYTAGTHLDLLWNKIQELMAILTNNNNWLNHATSIASWLNFDSNQIEDRVWRDLLDDPALLVTCLSLALYGEALTQKQSIADLRPYIPLNTPVLGKRNLVFRLILEGFNIVNPETEEKQRILNFIREQSGLGQNFDEEWFENGFLDENGLKSFMEAVKRNSLTAAA